MPSTCSAYGCTNRRDKEKDIHFFSFPLNNPELLKKWLNKIKRKNFLPTKYSKVCSDHFLTSDFQLLPGFRRKLLQPEAVPSVFVEFPEHLKPKMTKKRNTRTSNKIEESFDFTNNDTKIESMPITTEVQRFSIAVQTDEQTDIVSLESQNRIRILTQRVKRQNLKLQKLTSIIKHLRLENQKFEKVKKFSDNVEVEGTVVDIYNNEIRNKLKFKKSGRRYSDKIKKFALTLHYASRSAYNFCRTIFSLPHPRSITYWTSSVNAEPGFLSEVFDALIDYPDENKDVNLVIDAMSIRKSRVWDNATGKFNGYPDFGNIIVDTGEVLATEALVFMLVCLNGSWKLPVAYFLQNKITGNLLGELINTCIKLCFKQDIRVRSLTFDGCSANVAALEYLKKIKPAETMNETKIIDLNEIAILDEIETINESEINIEELIEFKFPHPCSNSDVFVIFDPCHMVKLARNALEAYKTLKYGEEIISWRFIEELQELQEIIGLRFANKLSKRHIRFINNKMKVKYAVQTLSSSVADAIDFLRKSNIPQFHGSEGTTYFIRQMDRIFDFLNSRSPLGTGYKKPIKINDMIYYERTVKEWTDYLLSLMDANSVPMYLTQRKRFVIGLCTALKSVLCVSQQLLCSPYYKYVLTYKFSQDHIELLFATIRLRLGCNDNPNVTEFKTSLKKILLKNDLRPSAATNCVLFDSNDSNGIFDFSTKKSINKDNKKQSELDLSDLELEVKTPDHFETNYLKDNILFYICGYIARKLAVKIMCESCCSALLFKGQYEHNYCFHYSTFTNLKNRGGLRIPSMAVFRIVKETENAILLYSTNLKILNSKNILMKVKNELAMEPHLFQLMSCENEDLENNHKLSLINLICKYYIKIRMYSMSKSVDEASNRNKLKKIITFKNF